jgi:hypothetical protein
MDWLVILVASAVFGGSWWLLSKNGAHVFFVAMISLLLALLVIQSRTLFGLPL